MEACPTRIGLFGLFGCGNSGNDGSLEAMLLFLRRVIPDAQLTCICPAPERVKQEFGVAAIDVGWPGSDRSLIRLLDRLLLRGPHVLRAWLYALKQVRSFDFFVIPGTGILDDFATGPSGVPYVLFRWCVAAWLCGTKVAFVSVGAGPIRHPLSRWLMKRAATVAEYRSYRDTISKQFMDTIGFDTRRDAVYPDLAFKLGPPRRRTPARDAKQPLTIGLGVMAYGGWRDAPEHRDVIFRKYLEQIMTFLIWLLDHGYRVRLLMGDTADQRAVADLVRAVEADGRTIAPQELTAAPTFSLHHLMQEIVLCDIVVATRFHNVVCALRLGKPTISIAYADKNDALLATMGLGEFTQHIETLDVRRLVHQFNGIVSDRCEYERRISDANRHYAGQLARQDALLAAWLQQSGSATTQPVATDLQPS